MDSLTWIYRFAGSQALQPFILFRSTESRQTVRQAYNRLLRRGKWVFGKIG